jgi:hypothetical protein
MVGLGALVSACADDASQPGEPPAAQFAGIVSNRDFIIASRPPSDSAAAILAGQPTGFWWVHLTIPASAISGTNVDLRVDLSSLEVPVRFVQSYQGSCDPSDAARTDRCWLVEDYVAGQTGLSGSLSVSRGAEGLGGGYNLHWEGDTDRFDGPTQWLSEDTTGGWHVGAANVVEVTP